MKTSLWTLENKLLFYYCKYLQNSFIIFKKCLLFFNVINIMKFKLNNYYVLTFFKTMIDDEYRHSADRNYLNEVPRRNGRESKPKSLTHWVEELLCCHIYTLQGLVLVILYVYTRRTSILLSWSNVFASCIKQNQMTTLLRYYQ